MPGAEPASMELMGSGQELEIRITNYHNRSKKATTGILDSPRPVAQGQYPGSLALES